MLMVRANEARQTKEPNMVNENVPAWFEIPAYDLERAQRFYEHVTGTSLKRENFGGSDLVVFPYKKPGSSGALVKGKGFTPSEHGTIVYINLDDIRPALSKVETAGGAVVLPRTELPGGIGFFAQIRDTEGNRVGVFSPA
jgi:predicted enzyme related to lactoylglutathione lyase